MPDGARYHVKEMMKEISAKGSAALACALLMPATAEAKPARCVIKQIGPLILTVIDARHAFGLVGQQRFDHTPLEIGQIISTHADAESQFAELGKWCAYVNPC